MDFDNIDEMIAFEEAQTFDDQYADEYDVLNDIQGGSDDLPDLSTTTSQPKSSRKLFDDIPDTEENLVIDEEEDEISSFKKRVRASDEDDEMEMPQAKKPSMPTTLDADREIINQRIKDNESTGLRSPELINKILKRRQQHTAKTNTADVLDNAPSSVQPSFQLTRVLVHPPHCDYMPATSSHGNRVYMRMRQCAINKELLSSIKSGSLLTTDIAKLRQSVQNKKLKHLYQESMRITSEIRSRDSGISESQEVEALSEIIDSNADVDVQAMAIGNAIEKNEIDQAIEQNIIDNETKKKSEDGLWLNKYAPSQYTHLLSDETVNRALLKWLKMWDPLVFNREYKSKKEVTKEPTFQDKFKKYDILEHIDDKVDEYKRPIWKLAMLCGPPGLGKTTLAHIIAKHAGYHVVEMNASDDRSPAAFRSKLEETTEMTSVLANDGRPNCLIIDEIDGAPTAAINVLLQAANKVKAAKKSTNKKRKQMGGILMRPIICICNNLYTPSLRQLRQQSLVLHFPPTASSILAIRLSQLCRLQQLKCDTTTLLTLCEKAENDIRSCINTLQFIQSNGVNRLSLSTIKSMEIGQKDQHKSIFTIWNEIFQLPKSKRKIDRDTASLRTDERFADQKISQMSARFYTVLQMVSANGDYDKTLQGVYENFLNMKFKDPDMSGLRKAYEWLQFYDHINTKVHEHQEWTLYRYMPFLFVFFHLLFACVSVPRIQYPTTQAEFNKKRQQTENLLQMMFGEMYAGTRCFVSTSNAALDVLPYLTTIATPQIRPVNAQLFNAIEKVQMHDLVSTMLSYNLTYHQHRDEEGKYDYLLEPNVLEICRFDVQQHFKLSYATKQMISKEVELERIRRSEKLMHSSNETNNQNAPNKNVQTPRKEKKGEKHVPNHLQRLEDNISNTQVTPDKPAMDFFKRFKKIKRLNEDGSVKEKPVHADPGIGNSHIWYRFNEGFSNAVRRTLLVKEFL